MLHSNNQVWTLESVVVCRLYGDEYCSRNTRVLQLPSCIQPSESQTCFRREKLDVLQMQYTEKHIDIFNGQSLTPGYMRLNPHGWSPTLVTKEEILTESLDIVKWADRQGSSLGGDAVDRTFVSEWLTKVNAWDGNLFAMFNSPARGMFRYVTKFKIKTAESYAQRFPDLADVYRKKVVSMKQVLREVDDAETVNANMAQLVALLDEAEMRLRNFKFLAGNQYSVADVIFTPVVYRLFSTKKDQEYLNSRPHIRTYYQDLKTRSSYKKVFGISDTSLGTMWVVLPALLKVFWTNFTRRY
ncbi:glutathione S-transferase TCHQD isoform X4 [Physcomitrium patens]|uniref:glutathione S-transferase TCHQD isoform X4 n=1 Tax=Physcomitrium patens TaxID=3218 RepID=UPI003CCD27D0